MRISMHDWVRYRDLMTKISRQAADDFEKQFKGKVLLSSREEVIAYAAALVEKYSDASSELACQMYERIAELSGATVPPAIPAEAASYGEVAKGINGTLKQSPEGKLCSDVIDRLVKRAGADTMLQNAKRDGAQFAWIPAGDTCSFCIMLASRGWQYISDKSFKNGHAEHIHAHCDCQYAVRFDDKTTVEGYDPDKYLEMYENAEGDTWQEKLNAMRREQSKEEKALLTGENTRGIMNVRTNKKRNETPLTDEQIKECIDYAMSLGMPKDKISYRDNYFTGYSVDYDILLLGTDAYPNKDSKDINGRLSYKCAIAHEIVGHREAAIRGRAAFDKDDPRDEAQASIRAARFAPGLSKKERYMLLGDAVSRLKGTEYSLKDIRALLDIDER